MRRLIALTLIMTLTLALVACAGPSDQGTSSSPDPSTPAETAPGFSLELGNGRMFNLADENRPVYLLFWAEW